MRLEVFNVIDDALAILQRDRGLYENTAEYIKKVLFEAVEDGECCLNAVTRVKEPESLKEKIIRKKLYSRYGTGEAVMDGISDIIGIRLECRFIKDEDTLYRRLVSCFSVQPDGLFYHQSHPDVGLELSAAQPQKQRNGVDIYRIDGVCLKDGRRLRFELQIKSLVKVFWAEIEHKIVYKNNSYRLMDDFLNKLMFSINNNLESIDQQLMLVYEQTNRHDADADLRDGAVRQLLAKAINDTLYTKMSDEMGFTVNFKKPCEILADFALSTRVTGSEPSVNDMETMGKLLGRVRKGSLNMQESIEMDREIRQGDGFGRTMASAFTLVMNKDFEWNLFFRVLFILEPNDNAGDMEFFISYLRSELSRCASPDGNTVKALALQDVLEQTATSFSANPDISFIEREHLDTLANAIGKYLEMVAETVESPAEWEKYRQHFLAWLGQYLPA